MSDKIGIALLAAGKGTRMKINRPKTLAPLMGRTILDFILDSLKEFSLKKQLHSSIGLVVGHQKELVKEHIENFYPEDKKIVLAHQKEQLGTADALKSYFHDVKGAWDKDYTFVVCGDTPLLTSYVFEQMYELMEKESSLDGVCASFYADDPAGYGRIIKSPIGFQIVEEKDATNEQKQIKEVNSGLYLLKTSFIKERLALLDSNNKAGEFLLTDLFQKDFQVKVMAFEDSQTFLGINTLEQLEQAESILRKKKTKKLQLSGVRLIDSSSCYIDWNAEIEAGSTIYPNVVIEGKTRIGESVVIESGVVIKDSEIGPGSSIYANSYLEEASVGRGVSVGPMARLRPGADLKEKVKIGNFVEVKKSTLHKGSKVSHLSYVGDAEIGEEANIGCGFISCNYDGVQKHKTIIGKRTFVGSDVQAVAPVKIGDDALIAAGSTITHDVPDGAFAIARGRQETKEGFAKKFPVFRKKKS